jgi:hypothetical protein
MRFDVRRLAAVDMRGPGPLPGRRPLIIVVEFITGTVLCGGLGALILATGTSHPVVGYWLVGAGGNYAPLALHALSLRKPERLATELAGVDVRQELVFYGLGQFLIAVPGVVLVVSLIQLPGQLRALRLSRC